MFGDVSSGYAFGFQILFPLILVFCSSIFFLYLINPSDVTNIASPTSNVDSPNNTPESDHDSAIVIG